MEIAIIETRDNSSEHMDKVNKFIKTSKTYPSIEVVDIETHVNVREFEFEYMHYISVIKLKET